MDENYAYLTCKCGVEIQVLKQTEQLDDDGNIIITTDWDEEATALKFSEHKC